MLKYTGLYSKKSQKFKKFLTSGGLMVTLYGNAKNAKLC